VIARPIAPMSGPQVEDIADTPGHAFAAQGSPLWFVAWHTPIAASGRLSGMGVPTLSTE
jgi:hypothetical protein